MGTNISFYAKLYILTKEKEIVYAISGEGFNFLTKGEGIYGRVVNRWIYIYIKIILKYKPLKKIY